METTHEGRLHISMSCFLPTKSAITIEQKVILVGVKNAREQQSSRAAEQQSNKTNEPRPKNPRINISIPPRQNSAIALMHISQTSDFATVRRSSKFVTNGAIPGHYAKRLHV